MTGPAQDCAGPATAPTLYPGALTDVEGLAVGHAALAGRPSGCTVILCPQGAHCGVDVRGGAPGTRETDLLRPGNLVQQVHALLLTGGSAYGLDAAGGVMRWLEAHGHGFVMPAPPDHGGAALRVPIVPAAVLFDLWLGDPRLRPDADTGWAACAAACSTPPAQGNAGAGLGATVGKLWGLARAMKGGLGTASLSRGGVVVGALVAVNALGDVLDDEGRVIAGARDATGTRLLDSRAALLQGDLPPRLAAGLATTIGAVATNVRLDAAQVNKLASLAHHGLARAVNPLTLGDGDTLFALATARHPATPDLGLLGALAAEAVTRAVRNAVWAAQALADPPLPAARDLRAGGAATTP